MLNYFLRVYQADKIHATVRKGFVDDDRQKVQKGHAYLIEKFMVGFNEGPFKLTPHKHKITMMQGYRFTKLADLNRIPLNSLEFVSYPTILQSSVEDKVVGKYIYSYKFSICQRLHMISYTNILLSTLFVQLFGHVCILKCHRTYVIIRCSVSIKLYRFILIYQSCIQ